MSCQKAPYKPEGEKVRPAPTKLQIIKMKLGAARRVATAATVLERFQDIPQLRGVTDELTAELDRQLRGLTG